MSLSTTSTRLLNISRDGDSTTSLGSLFPCWTTLSMKTFFLISSLNLPWRNLRPFPLVLSLAAVESDEVSPQPPFLQAQQPQVPQPLPISLVLQTLPQLCCPSLDTLQPLHVSLGVGGPTLNTAFEVRPHQCPVQGHDHCPSPAGHTIPDTSQDAIGLLGHLGTLSVPMLDNPFSEDISPNIQFKPPLVQLEAISSRPITCYLGEETDPHLATTSFQAVVESDEVSPQSLLFSRLNNPRSLSRSS
ncbi:hypothetical protein QYF61_012125 [Mycteria americana]|uniref:Uncharacterized protein n=1 Tax=Mycteria americana TaxID=33587 RepID=A0AAN7PJ35_MYCAM|nr:hypothetical protein QYF61_012125 [Mycteria americana]